MNSQTIQCERHGLGTKAYVCGHLLKSTGAGFFFDTGDQEPVAWCYLCETVRLSNGDWDDDNVTEMGLRLVCMSCYSEIAKRNQTKSLDPTVAGVQ